MIEKWANNVVLVETEKRRLEVLEYLLAQPGYEAAASVIRLHCARLGVPSTMDQVLGAFGWLEEQELVTVRVYEDETIARITAAGREVADGSRSVPGVMRPDP